MAKQIKAFVEVETYVEVNQGRGADPTSLMSSLLVSDELGDVLTHLAEAATGAGAPARVLSGPYGVGKSTALSALYALARKPELGTRSPASQIRSVAGYFSSTKLVPVFVDAAEAATPTLEEALRAAFGAAVQEAAAAGVSVSEWNIALESDEWLDRAIALAGNANARLFLIVDGLSAWMRSADRAACREAVELLSRAGEIAVHGSCSVAVAVDEDALEGETGACAPLMRFYQVEYMPLAALASLCDRFVFKKDGRQRRELGALYDELKRTLRNFRWSREEFIALYPLHPVLLEVSPALRRHAASFSLPRFASASGSRAKGRRELSLVVLDEPFDQFEYELRKDPELATGFESYDYLANTVVPTLQGSQERLWAKLLLKALFLASLAGRSKSALALANTMMLYDEGDVEASTKVVHGILSRFEERGGQRFAVETIDGAKSYRLIVGTDRPSDRVVADVAREISSSDPRLADALVAAAASRFPDWPAALDGGAIAAEIEIPWRGTMREGVVSYRVAHALEEIPPLDTGLPPSDLDLSGFGDDVLDLGGGAGVALAPADEPVQPVAVEFVAAESICEYDWEVALLPIGWRAGDPGAVAAGGPTTLALWEPANPAEGDIDVLRRLVALSSNDPRLEAAGLDVPGLRAEAEAEAGLLFHRLYLEGGRFVGPSWTTPAVDQAARETLGGLLARTLDAPLAERFPQHPTFGGDVDESVVRLLVEKFFVGGTPREAEVQQAAAAAAAPLGLAEAPERRGSYAFNPDSETILAQPFNVEPLRLAEAGGEIGVPLDALYQTLRRTPFGLQRPVQKLVLAALIGSGRVKLVGPEGELTSEGLGSAGTLEGYTHLKRSGLTVYSSEQLLEWCRQITDTHHLNDIVTADGRQLIRKALEDWLSRWRELDLNTRFNEVPPEAATRRTWQLIATSKQYFETTARCVRSVLDEEVSLEEGIGRIVNTFAANPTMYQRAVRDLRMLTTFVDWVPTYTTAKEYVLAADRTAEQKIEAERSELLGFISAPHRLLDENKRRRFETVYETYRKDYIDYYATAHDVHVGSRADFEALEAFLEDAVWRRFEMLSQVRVVNPRYYQLASATVQTIRDLHCDVPTREILLDRPACVCSFRLSHADSTARLLGRLRSLVESGTEHHTRTIGEYRKDILSGIREVKSTGSFSDASVPLIALLSGNEEQSELTPSVVELINRCLADRPAPIAVTLPPLLEPGEAATKRSLRDRIMQWLDDLPGDDAALIEITQLLPAPGDD